MFLRMVLAIKKLGTTMYTRGTKLTSTNLTSTNLTNTNLTNTSIYTADAYSPDQFPMHSDIEPPQSSLLPLKQHKRPIALQNTQTCNERTDYVEILDTLYSRVKKGAPPVFSMEEELLRANQFTQDLCGEYVIITEAIRHFFTFPFIVEFTPANYRAAVSLKNHLDEYYSHVRTVYYAAIKWYQR